MTLQSARPASAAGDGQPVSLIDLAAGRPDRRRDELLASLADPVPWISPKFLYDRLGSTLFNAICELDEYYPTRTESAIFDRFEAEIGAAVGTGCTLIDLGAGDCVKARRLLPVLVPAQYVAVDISADYLKSALEALRREHPALDVVGVVEDFSGGLSLPGSVRQRRRLYFYPGSSIGNFGPDDARRLLRGLRSQCDSNGGLLIGVDLVKPVDVLEAAYADRLGVTAAFNLNLLRNVNRILGADFDVTDWKHVARFDPGHSRIEMHLEARRDLQVAWQGGGRPFAAGTRIHTENSYKYLPSAFESLLRDGGFEATRMWTDERQWFAVFHARPA